MKMTRFQITGPVRTWSARFGEVDLSRISDQQAERLYQAGFPYLKKTESPPAEQVENPEKPKPTRKRR